MGLKGMMENAGGWMHLVFRLIVGLFFALHGAQKLGLTGGTGMQGFMMFIGVCELLAGIAIFLGVLTRFAALGGAVIMIGAIVKVHTPISWAKFTSGEGAWLFLAAFLILAAYGAGKWSLEKLALKKELLWD